MKFTVIEFKFVSKSIGTQLISNGSDFVDLIDSSIWLRFGHRFIDDFSNDQWNCRFLQKVKTFCPINIYYSSSWYHPKNVTDLQNRSSYFRSNNERNSDICYDFKEMEVTATHYSILSCAPSQSTPQSPGVWKYQEMVNHGLKSIDAKTTLTWMVWARLKHIQWIGRWSGDLFGFVIQEESPQSRLSSVFWSWSLWCSPCNATVAKLNKIHKHILLRNPFINESPAILKKSADHRHWSWHPVCLVLIRILRRRSKVPDGEVSQQAQKARR
jgi:hypothetical protein